MTHQTLTPAIAHEWSNALTKEIGKHIIGQRALIERLLVALVANGHLLLEGMPGLAKTRTLTVLSSCLHCSMSRIQFTPDLLPSDLVGTEIYRPQLSDFALRQGPIFANILLADEINRAPAKVQSALLQAMQEREVTIGETTLSLPDPFLVLATQNPIEQEGTYPLPEAQLDRFLMKVKVGYPSFEEELEILKVTASDGSAQSIAPLLGPEQIIELRRGAQELFVDERIDRYIVSLVQSSRNGAEHGLKGMLDWGASPRASIALKHAARALAFIRGRSFVTPDEVRELAPDILRHRLLPSFEADARGIGADEMIQALLKSVPVP